MIDLRYMRCLSCALDWDVWGEEDEAGNFTPDEENNKCPGCESVNTKGPFERDSQ